MRYEKHFYEGRNSGLQYYEIRNDLKPLVLLHAQAVDSASFFAIYFIYASAARLPAKCSTRPTATPASAGHTQPRPSRASGM